MEGFFNIKKQKMERLFTQKVEPWQIWISRIFELVKIVVILTMIGYLGHVFMITLFVVGVGSIGSSPPHATINNGNNKNASFFIVLFNLIILL